MIHRQSPTNSTQRFIDKLSEIQARHGKYWIYGNHDHGGYGTEKIAQVMSSAGFQLLKNETTKIQKDGDTSISLDWTIFYLAIQRLPN